MSLRTSVLLDRVRATCPGFEAVDHLLTSADAGTYPAALISPVKAEASPAMFVGAHVQEVRATYGIHVVLEPSLDGPFGAGAADLLDDLRDELRTGLLAWTPDPALYAPLSYLGGDLIELRPGLFAFREDWSTTYELRKL